MPSEPRPLPRWMDFFTIGKMPLPAAWGVGWIIGMGLTFMIVSLLAESDLDRLIFFLWLMVPTGLTPLVARIKRRRTILWALLSVVMFLIGIVQPYFQPIMALAAVTLAGKPAIRIPEAELEASESPSGMRALAQIGHEVAVIQTAMAREYVHRDVAKLSAHVPDLERIDGRISTLVQQESERGHRARMHVTAAARILLRAGETAVSVEQLVHEYPDLQSFIDGRVVSGRGKPAKQIVKSLDTLEQMVGRSANQLLVANAVLDALGYYVEAPREDFDGETAETNLTPLQAVEHPRPKRTKRRQRF